MPDKQMVNNRYEKIIELEKSNELMTLISLGLMSLKMLDWKVYYERYLQNINDGSNKWSSVKEVAAHYDVTTRTILYVIKFMETK